MLTNIDTSLNVCHSFLEADIFYFLRDTFQPLDAYTSAHYIVVATADIAFDANGCGS